MPYDAELKHYTKLLRLVPLDTEAAAATVQADATVPRSRFRGLWSFVLFVALPTLLATVYFGLLAADRYTSEARFVLRMPNRSLANAAMGLALQNSGGGLAGSMGASRSTDDGYLVQDFLESRDAMAFAAQHSGLKSAWDAVPAKFDLLWRFPNPFEPRGDEGLFRHFQRMVTATYDSTTGVNTLQVQAFSSPDAQRIANSLLTAAEGLVNRLNERARRDTVARADLEAKQLRARLDAAQANLTAFRERERLIDPSQATMAVLETIAKLAQEAALLSVQIGELGRGSPDSPQISPLRARRSAIEAQIALERQQLAGDAKSIAPRIVEYERLMLEREFAEKALVSAMTALEAARVDALAQQVYLERVTQPSIPDYPTHPWRLLWCMVVAVVGFMAWRMWRIVSEDTMAHADR